MNAPSPRLTLPGRLYAGAILTLCCVIGLELLYFNARPDPGDVDGLYSPPEAAATPLAGGSAAQLESAPISAYSQIVERPLFSETRRPAAVKAEAVASRRAGEMASQWKLTGVVAAGDETYVLVQGVRNRQTLHLQQGGLLDGWRVDEIGVDYVSLASGDESVTLELRAEVGETR